MPPPPAFEDAPGEGSGPRGRLRLWHAVLVALLLHLAGILTSDTLNWRHWLSTETISVLIPPAEEAPREIPFRIVEDDDEIPPPPQPPPETVWSDRDRAAASPPAEEPEPATNPQPRSRGNVSDLVPRISPLPPEPPRGTPGAPSPPEEGGPAADAPEEKPSEEGEEPVESPAGSPARSRRGLLDDLRALQAGEKPMGPVLDNPEGATYADAPGISFETKGVDWGPYAEKIYWIVKRNWIIPPAAQVGNKGVTRLRFIIERDGTIRDLQVLRQSGFKSMDDSAQAAISNSGPLPPPPIPEDFPEDHVAVQWTFYYNVRPSD